MRIPYKPTKPAGGDPRRLRRLRRCVNQDRSRGRNYTSNRGGHATFNGSVRLDTSGTRPFVEAVRVRTPDAAMRTSPSHVYYPWQVFQRWRLQSPEGRLSIDGDFNRRRGLYSQAVLPKMPGASSFSKTGRYRVPSTLARRQQFSWRRNQQETLPRGLRTAVATTTSRPLQAGRKCRRLRGLGRSSLSKDLNRRRCPDYPA